MQSVTIYARIESQTRQITSAVETYFFTTKEAAIAEFLRVHRFALNIEIVGVS